ncbi:hypothetical protein EEB15_29915 [Ramlibacter sp. WS9]|nr:hypothetical protein EEB15_29915 [Ramlibacter sp. WS9]
MTGEAVNAVSMAFWKAFIERAMGAGRAATWATRPAGPSPNLQPTSSTAVPARPFLLTGGRPVRIELPRDRDVSFVPMLVPKHGRRSTGFHEIINP